MNAAEKILKELNTPEGKEKINKWWEEEMKRQNAENIKIQEMLSNTDYLKWLDKFTIKHPSFSDDDWLYFPQEISENDRKQVNNLNLLYSGIEKYSKENYIYPDTWEFGDFYKIRLENIGFEIGIAQGQGTKFFCNRIKIEKEKDFINFNNIINNKRNDNVDTIKNKLKELSNKITSLYESGIPLEAIIDTLESTLIEINCPKEPDEFKVLVKNKFYNNF